jgi:two-component system sensor histidine kinase UhpB
VASRGLGWGLANMRERARLLGGSFEIRTTPGKGTAVCVSLPLDPNFKRKQRKRA